MSKGSRTDLCGGWPERAIPTATGGGGRPKKVQNSNYFPTQETIPSNLAALAACESVPASRKDRRGQLGMTFGQRQVMIL
jgi:hypothetical protein